MLDWGVGILVFMWVLLEWLFFGCFFGVFGFGGFWHICCVLPLLWWSCGGFCWGLLFVLGVVLVVGVVLGFLGSLNLVYYVRLFCFVLCCFVVCLVCFCGVLVWFGCCFGLFGLRGFLGLGVGVVGLEGCMG
jgi:hypothetical protein